jgi:hypothetical protein
MRLPRGPQLIDGFPRFGAYLSRPAPAAYANGAAVEGECGFKRARISEAVGRGDAERARRLIDAHWMNGLRRNTALFRRARLDRAR